MTRTFKLQFNRSRIPALAAQYDYPDDSEAREAGKRILKGDYSRSNLVEIARWKSPRSVGRVKANSDRDVQDALRLAVDARTERAAIAVLTGLRGIDIPVASAIMAAIRPERFTIIDFRALQALGVDSLWLTIDLYLEYLACCRKLAPRRKGGLRQLDRAMWQWSKNRSR